jgi:surface protein
MLKNCFNTNVYLNIQIKVKQILLSALIILVFNACQDFEVPEYQGEVKFSLDNVKFINTASPNARIETNSLWKHIYKANAVLNIKHTASGKEYTLDYNPNTFGTFSKTLPYGTYTFESTVAGGVFEEYLPYTTSGQFTLESENLEISLTATTDYGLVTVKNQTVSIAKVTAGTTSKNLKLLDDKTYYYIYAKAQTSAALAITETVFGTTINRTIPMLAYKHFNYIIDLKQGNLNLIDLVLNPFGYEEEVISSVNAKFFEENGTIKCPNTVPGETGIVNGKKYEAVDRALLIQRRDEGADLTCVCTTLVTDMSEMFMGTEENINQFNQPIGNWDVSNVTSMRRVFRLSEFNQSIENWDVSNVTIMERMFSGSLFNRSIADWNTGQVKDMEGMFIGSPFNQPIGNWDVSNVENMQAMFQGFGEKINKFNQPIENWNVSKVTNMSNMFRYSQFNQPIGDWDVGNVTNMESMFSVGMISLPRRGQNPFNQSLENWDVSNVTNMSQMFIGSEFNQPIGNWDVSNVTNMSYMFAQAQFNQPIGNWDVSNVIGMSGMFSGSEFNKPIGNWNVGKVTHMSYMFQGFGEKNKFNQPIDNWNISNVKFMRGMFENSLFNLPIGNWDVSNVTDMSSMFNTSIFNQPIGNWDVSNVTTMQSMFLGTPFNQPIGDWNVSNVTNMNSMFRDTNNFNQNISNWCVTKIATEPSQFSLNSALTTQNKPIWGTCTN